MRRCLMRMSLHSSPSCVSGRPVRGWLWSFVSLLLPAPVKYWGCKGSEIDLGKKIWTVPAARMKAGRDHRVPLSSRAVAILLQLEKLKAGYFVFAGQARNKPLSNMAMEMVLRRMKIDDATVHGFRSSFRGWAGNVSSFPREVVETGLAHVIGDKAEQAYRRSDALEKRRKLKGAWAAYCEPKTSENVVPMHKQTVQAAPERRS
jgi:integrase